jgi:acetyl esterase/lipase
MQPARVTGAVFVFLVLISVTSSAQSTRPGTRRALDGDLLDERRYRLPAFDSLTADQLRELSRSTTRDAYERVRRDARFTLRVVAYVYGRGRTGAPSTPVVIYNKGSYVTGDQAPVLAPMFRRLAGAGFLVVAPQYRGSDGGEGHDEMGGRDVHDVLNAARLAARLPGADSTRVFMYGESRGGMMTYQALRDGVPVRAAAVVGAFTDLDSLLAADPRSRGAAAMIWPEFQRDRGNRATALGDQVGGFPARAAADSAWRRRPPGLTPAGAAAGVAAGRAGTPLRASHPGRRQPHARRAGRGAGLTRHRVVQEERPVGEARRTMNLPADTRRYPLASTVCTVSF